MNEKVNTNSKYRCNICNKLYSSQCSLCNHNKKFHTHCNNLLTTNNNLLTTKKYICKYCNKEYNLQQSRWKHEKNCKTKINNNNEIDTLKNTVNELKNQVSLLLKEKGKIHHKTLQKINNQLNNTISNVNQGNINNGNIINNTFVKFGDLDYKHVFTDREIKHILNQQYQSLEESIKQTHFNEKLPEYSNIFITNMKDDLGYVFNGKEFISIRKNEMINELINVHTKEINLSLEKNKNKLNKNYVIRLEKFLDMLNDDYTTFTDNDNNRKYSSYKAYKINSIKLLLYNNSDKKKLDLLNNMELKEKTYDTESLDDYSI
jgi:hypothetical protein